MDDVKEIETEQFSELVGYFDALDVLFSLKEISVERERAERVAEVACVARSDLGLNQQLYVISYLSGWSFGRYLVRAGAFERIEKMDEPPGRLRRLLVRFACIVLGVIYPPDERPAADAEDLALLLRNYQAFRS